MTMITEEQIWNYLDGTLDNISRVEVEQDIAADENTAMLFKEISALHAHLNTALLMKPSLSFTDNVMASANTVNLPAPAISVKTMLLFFLPTAAVILIFIALLFWYHIPVSLDIPSIDFGRFKVLLVLADALLFVYALDAWPEKRGHTVTT